jgi:hypothetical protein
MRIGIRTVALVMGVMLSLAAGAAGGAARPSFDALAGHRTSDPWRMDPCGPYRPITGICRMLRPVNG